MGRACTAQGRRETGAAGRARGVAGPGGRGPGAGAGQRNPPAASESVRGRPGAIGPIGCADRPGRSTPDAPAPAIRNTPPLAARRERGDRAPGARGFCGAIAGGYGPGGERVAMPEQASSRGKSASEDHRPVDRWVLVRPSKRGPGDGRWGPSGASGRGKGHPLVAPPHICRECQSEEDAEMRRGAAVGESAPLPRTCHDCRKRQLEEVASAGRGAMRTHPHQRSHAPNA